jgi:hypothetical protein
MRDVNLAFQSRENADTDTGETNEYNSSCRGNKCNGADIRYFDLLRSRLQ